MSARIELVDPHPASLDVPDRWRAIHAAAPQVAATMLAYVAQMAVSMRPSTARAIETAGRSAGKVVIDMVEGKRALDLRRWTAKADPEMAGRHRGGCHRPDRVVPSRAVAGA